MTEPNYGQFQAMGGYSSQVTPAAASSYSSIYASGPASSVQYGAYGQVPVIDESKSVGYNWENGGAGAAATGATDSYYITGTDLFSAQTGTVGYYQSGGSATSGGYPYISGSQSAQDMGAAVYGNSSVIVNQSYTPNQPQTYAPAYVTGNSEWQPTGNSGGTTPGSNYKATAPNYRASTASSSATTNVLDAAVYSAAASYLHGSTGQKLSWKERIKVNGPPDPSLWKYCELCKVNCAGGPAYKMHIEGRAHRRREQNTLCGTTTTGASAVSYYCQLCDVPCTSVDIYTSHVRGAKHQRVLKLQQRMGVTIPDIPAEPVAIHLDASKKTNAVSKAPSNFIKTILGTPKMTFVGGTMLQPTVTGLQEVQTHSNVPEATSLTSSTTIIGPVKPAMEDMEVDDKNVQPIGLEYIDETMNNTKSGSKFYCNLCECSFTDIRAKYLHSKGRRHRMQYKKKVDPTLKVDVKESYSSKASKAALPVSDSSIGPQADHRAE